MTLALLQSSLWLAAGWIGYHFLLRDTRQFALNHAYQWLWMYNNDRPHQALTGLTPKQFLLQYGKLQDQTITEEFPTFQQKYDDEYDNFKPLFFTVA